MKYKFKIQYKKYFKFGGSNENPPENEFSNLNINDSTNPVRIFDDNDYQPLYTKPENNTYSYYFMPPLAEAYFIIKEQPVPQKILNKAGRLINTGCIDKENYNKLIYVIVDYLNSSNEIKNDFLNAFTEENQTVPNEDYEGHIKGFKQVQFLENAKITGDTTITFNWFNENRFEPVTYDHNDNSNVYLILSNIIMWHEIKNNFYYAN